ncbi:hypothetical protein EIN_222520 [Entamoeba invadens IP1]|uniref:Transcriptional coactivator p15 (PC4) C-terminal domain-containing protein n=1 Tax=Entamoeba invadens IP1 TaxID=370355 RepID=A0A0A1U250_ENTIV|nr:hypothetical protein EIN_222520 [Entamoeba invadens IP1]ELP88099.1 hypothetical protein EIN_222520 [Entamoeba invadens IP1]|eukprot:XP_004254870.1 hypothetical protein EIN_222520 [Entamoeba invadens IP1]
MKPMAQKKQLGYFQNIQPFQKSVTTIKGQEPPMIIKQQPIPRVQKQKKVNESPTLEKGNDILSRVIDSNESTETEKSEGTFASDILSGHFDISNTKKSRQMLMEKDKQPDSLPPLSETKSVNDKVLIRIGENVFISKSEVNGEMCVDIREYNNICGRLNPTDKGILLGMKEWNTIMKSVPFLTKWLSATPSI